MKYLLALSIFLFTLHARAQRSSIVCDSITWAANRKLTWADFKSPANEGNPFAAITYESISYSYTWRNNTLNLQTRTFFVPCLSWTKHRDSENLLLHEQGHFDIAELFRRLLVKSIAEANISSGTVKSDILKIYNSIYDQKHEYHAKYDSDTDFSRNKEKQLLWSQKIQRLINDLRYFNKETLTIAVR
jgi:hypothetical protein